MVLDTMTLKEFIESPIPNAWIYPPHISVYLKKLRKMNETNDGFITEYISIGNVEVRQEYRHQGIFSNFLKELEDMRIGRGIQINEIVTEQFVQGLQRRGYVLIEGRSSYALPSVKKDF